MKSWTALFMEGGGSISLHMVDSVTAPPHVLAGMIFNFLFGKIENVDTSILIAVLQTAYNDYYDCGIDFTSFTRAEPSPRQRSRSHRGYRGLPLFHNRLLSTPCILDPRLHLSMGDGVLVQR
jgi:hypothetical protein